MQNIELKAELRDMVIARAILRSLGAAYIATFTQTDTYYRIPDARLKRRETQGEPPEWVFYRRANKAGARESDFVLYTEQQAFDRFGREPGPVWVKVKKTRELWMITNTRIHLDTVDELGTFMEFESVVSPQFPADHCRGVVAEMQRTMQPAMGELIDCSYADLMDREVVNAPKA